MELLGFKKLSKLSECLEGYIKKIEKETNRFAQIKNVKSVGISGIFAGFMLDPTCIVVEVVEEDFLNLKEERNQQEAIDCVIAHEVTHGLLAYGRNYCQHNLVLDNTELKGRSADILFTMIEDIVVNKTVDENNLFQPIIKVYIDRVIEREIIPLREGKDCYEVNNHFLIYRNRFMVWRYIQAWSALRYFDFDNDDKKVINEYLERFQNKYPQQYEQAIKTKEIISENDIFTVEGFYKTIKKCLDLDIWNIQDIKIITTSEAIKILQASIVSHTF
jgi:hypothetical protein